MNKLLASALAAFFVLCTKPPLAFAQLPDYVTRKCPQFNVSSALGCIPVNDTVSFTAWFLGWAIGLAGGLAFLLIIFSGFQIMTASGDPQKLQSGRELLTAAISGLILIIFSVFLLRLIGVQIFHLPGL